MISRANYFENPTQTLSMSPKRTGLRRRRRVNIRPNIDALSAELHLREQQQASAIDSLRPLPLYTTEQLAIMNLQPDTRYPGRPLVSIDQNNNSPLSSCIEHEMHIDINLQSHNIEDDVGSNLSIAALEQDRRKNSWTSRFREELDNYPHQAPLFTSINDEAQSESQDKIMTFNLAVSLIAENSTDLINLRNARDLAAAKRSAELLIRSNRAKSTKKSYDQKIERWKQWCMKRDFEDHDVVTENKLFLYLNSEVIPNGVQTKGKRKGAALSEEGLDGYIKPIVALYKVSPLIMLF